MVFGQGQLVAVTDRGKRHRHNEDSAALGVSQAGYSVAVVCDGVSSTPGSAEASELAARSAVDTLLQQLDAQYVEDSQDAEAGLTTEALESILVEATEQAQNMASQAVEVESNFPGSQGGPPSCTFVAVVARRLSDRSELSAAWIGDSRAYWIGDGSMQLTVDHEIEGSLTRWLGADSENYTPDIAHASVEGTGKVVVCSDGLWRYASDPKELSDLIDRLEPVEGDLMILAESLVAFANESGGHDNITAALWSNDEKYAKAPEDPSDPRGDNSQMSEGEPADSEDEPQTLEEEPQTSEDEK